jgi:hypothetical protein
MRNLTNVDLIRFKAYLCLLTQVNHKPHAVTTFAIGSIQKVSVPSHAVPTHVPDHVQTEGYGLDST